VCLWIRGTIFGSTEMRWAHACVSRVEVVDKGWGRPLGVDFDWE
jgi:hypothetical protein